MTIQDLHIGQTIYFPTIDKIEEYTILSLINVNDNRYIIQFTNNGNIFAEVGKEITNNEGEIFVDDSETAFVLQTAMRNREYQKMLNEKKNEK